MNTTEETPHEAQQKSKKECDRCRALIHIDALKCLYCHKWRKDIAEDRKRFFTYAMIFSVSGVASVITFCAGNADGQFDTLGEWHERVATKIKVNSILGPQSVPSSEFKFSPGKFFSSFSGWALIACVIAIVWSGVLAHRARNSLERKWGSLWRL